MRVRLDGWAGPRPRDRRTAFTPPVVQETCYSPVQMSPTVLRIGRYRFFFFSNEGFEPAHVHVQSGPSLAKFWLGSVELSSSTGFAPHDLTELHALVVEHRDKLLEAWNEFFGS